jgi:hypothetical protein
MGASQGRKKKTDITQLKNQCGQVTNDEVEMQNLTADFLKNLYTSEGTKNMEAVLDTVPTKVSSVMNDKPAPFFCDRGEGSTISNVSNKSARARRISCTLFPTVVGSLWR